MDQLSPNLRIITDKHFHPFNSTKEQQSIDAVIIGADVPEQEEKVKQLRGIVLALKPNATAADVQWNCPNCSRNGRSPSK
jgi:hypothetical protein